MLNLQERYIIDASGNRVGVILDLKAWERLVEELEELDDLRAFDEVVDEIEDALPLEAAKADIARRRNAE